MTLRAPGYSIFPSERENQPLNPPLQPRTENIYGQQLITVFTTRSVKSIRTPCVFAISNDRNGTYEVHPYGIYQWYLPYPAWWKRGGYIFNLGRVLKSYPIQFNIGSLPLELQLHILFRFSGITEDNLEKLYLGDKKVIPGDDIIKFLATYRETINGESEAVSFLQERFSEFIYQKARNTFNDENVIGALREVRIPPEIIVVPVLREFVGEKPVDEGQLTELGKFNRLHRDLYLEIVGCAINPYVSGAAIEARQKRYAEGLEAEALGDRLDRIIASLNSGNISPEERGIIIRHIMLTAGGNVPSVVIPPIISTSLR